MRRLKQAWLSLRALMAARTVQDYLWGPVPGQRPNADFDGWVRVIESRIGKMRAIDRSGNRLWRVETRKRLLQIAAVAIAMIEWIDQGGA